MKRILAAFICILCSFAIMSHIVENTISSYMEVPELQKLQDMVLLHTNNSLSINHPEKRQRNHFEGSKFMRECIGNKNATIQTNMQPDTIKHHIENGNEVLIAKGYSNSVLRVFAYDAFSQLFSVMAEDDTTFTIREIDITYYGQSITGVVIGKEGKSHHMKIRDDLFNSLFNYEGVTKEEPIRFLSADASFYNYSEQQWYAQYVRDIAFSMNAIPIIRYEDYARYAEFWKKYIPEHFVYAMINASIIHDVPMDYIYAISRIESVNYKHFSSLEKNKNGTIDYGVMGLNSANFDTSKKHGREFLQKFYYNDNYHGVFDSENQLHIIKVCVKYLKALTREVGSYWNAVIAYNGGSSRVLSGKILSASLRYAEKVWDIRRTVKSFSTVVQNATCKASALYEVFVYYTDKEIAEASKKHKEKDTKKQMSLKMNRSKVSHLLTYTVREMYKALVLQSFDKKKIVEVHEDEGVFLGTLSENGNYIIM